MKLKQRKHHLKPPLTRLTSLHQLLPVFLRKRARLAIKVTPTQRYRRYLTNSKSVDSRLRTLPRFVIFLSLKMFQHEGLSRTCMCFIIIFSFYPPSTPHTCTHNIYIIFLDSEEVKLWRGEAIKVTSPFHLWFQPPPSTLSCHHA